MSFLRVSNFLFFLIIFFTFNCASLFKKAFQKPEVSYEGMLVESIDPAGATIRLFLGIDNKNNLDMKIDRMEHIAFIEDQQVAESIITDNVYIQPKNKTTVEFPIRITFSALSSNLKNLWDKKKINYRVDSKLFIKSAVGVLPFDLKYHDSFELPPLPDISIENIKIESMTFSDMDLLISVMIVNNDKMKIEMDELSYDISLNNLEIAKGVMNRPGLKSEIKGNKTDHANQITLQIPVRMKLLSLKKGITDMFRKGEIQYKFKLKIKGTSAYGSYDLPLEKNGITRIY